jgi:DNA-binding response OmpR family regulator
MWFAYGKLKNHIFLNSSSYPVSTNKMAHILVISDSYNLRISLASVLQRTGHNVKAASLGEMPYWLNAKTYDLLILELRSPYESGLKLLISIRSFYKLPIIILSPAAYPNIKQRALIHGAKAFLVEPVEPEIIVQCVQKTLRKNARINHNLKPVDYDYLKRDFPPQL